MAGSGPKPYEEVAFLEQLVWELEHLLAALSPRNSRLRNHVGQEPVGTRPALASPGAASAADYAPSESLVEQNICIVQRNWCQGGPAATRALWESTSPGAVTYDPTETVSPSPRVHILTLEIWSELGEI